MPAFVNQGVTETTTPVTEEAPKLEYPHVYDELGFSIDVVPSTGFYQSYSHEGEPIIYSMTHEECYEWTVAWLKAKQDGGWQQPDNVVNSGVVGGKL